MLTGLSTVATRSVPPRLGVPPWAHAARRTPGATSEPRVAAAAPPVCVSHSRRVVSRIVDFSFLVWGARAPLPPPQRSSGWRAVRTAVDDSVFHDEADVPEGVDVLQRVAVDRDEVGALAGGQGAHFGVDAAGLGAAARARDQRVARGAPQAHQGGELERHQAVHAV